jgi:hypothetical protein
LREPPGSKVGTPARRRRSPPRLIDRSRNALFEGGDGGECRTIFSRSQQAPTLNFCGLSLRGAHHAKSAIADFEKTDEAIPEPVLQCSKPLPLDCFASLAMTAPHLTLHLSANGAVVVIPERQCPSRRARRGMRSPFLPAFAARHLRDFEEMQRSGLPRTVPPRAPEAASEFLSYGLEKLRHACASSGALLYPPSASRAGIRAIL